MPSKIVVYLATHFPARPKQPAIICRPARIPTLGTQITQNQTPRASDDYSHMFQGF